MLAHADLIPVVELEPLTFAIAEHASPGGTAKESPEEWRAYWKACVADRGFDLEPLYPGSWSVALEDLVDPQALALVTTLACNVSEAPKDEASMALEETVRVVPGGYALRSEGRVVWHAGCCASLRDMSDWRDLLKIPPQTRFLGHTWLRSAAYGPTLEIGIRGEYERNETSTLQLPVARTDDMLAGALAEVERFRARLYDALAGHVPEEKRRALADLLTRTA